MCSSFFISYLQYLNTVPGSIGPNYLSYFRSQTENLSGSVALVRKLLLGDLKKYDKYHYILFSYFIRLPLSRPCKYLQVLPAPLLSVSFDPFKPKLLISIVLCSWKDHYLHYSSGPNFRFLVWTPSYFQRLQHTYIRSILSHFFLEYLSQNSHIRLNIFLRLDRIN